MTLGERQELFTLLFARLIIFIFEQKYFVRIGEVARTEYQSQYYATHCARCKQHIDLHVNTTKHKFKPIGILKSLHREGVAGDIKLLKMVGGVKLYLQDSKDYKIFGDWWKSQHELCRWGGDILKRPDGGHFSISQDNRI